MATSGPDARELLDEGSRYEKAGVFDRALAAYRAALANTADPAIIAESLRRQSHVHRARCEWDLAVEAAGRSARAAEDAGSAVLLAEAWNAEAAVHQSRGDFDAAIPLYERMLDAVAVGRVRGVALQNLAAIYATQGRLSDAERHFQRAYSAFDQAGDRWGMGYVLNNLGRLTFEQGFAARAGSILDEAARYARELHDLDLLAIIRSNRAEALLAEGDPDAAETEASAALGHFGAVANSWRRVECLRILGDISAAKQQEDSARRFFEAALAIAVTIGARVEQSQLEKRLNGLSDSDG